jgi:hypothetical protein
VLLLSQTRLKLTLKYPPDIFTLKVIKQNYNLDFETLQKYIFQVEEEVQRACHLHDAFGAPVLAAPRNGQYGKQLIVALSFTRKLS